MNNSQGLPQPPPNFASTEATAINIDSESQQLTPEENISEDAAASGNTMDRRSGGRPSVQQNLLSFINDARTQLGRHTSLYPTSLLPQSTAGLVNLPSLSGIGDGLQVNRMNQAASSDSVVQPSTEATSQRPNNFQRNVRSWRMNINDVLSFSNAPSRSTLRFLINTSGGLRNPAPPENAINREESAPYLNPHRPNYMLHGYRHQAAGAYTYQNDEDNSIAPQYGDTMAASSQTNQNHGIWPINVPAHSAEVQHHGDEAFQRNSNGAGPPNAAPQVDFDDANNVASDLSITALSHFMRYLPFICIIFVKFVHDHLLGILDLLLLHSIMYQINKSLREQVAKLSQKSYSVLLRNLMFVAVVVVYRLLLITGPPDPFGLIIVPPTESVDMPNARPTLDIDDVVNDELDHFSKGLDSAKSKTIGLSRDTLEDTHTVTKPIPLGILLYYVAVNDLVLKLITMAIKICITLMPGKLIRTKSRARMYVLIEYTSQFYRALAPVHQWLIYLFQSYSGMEVISGIFFSSFYIGAKGFEVLERSRTFKKALFNFIRNMDYERKPTKDELEAAGLLCPICHESYTKPVALECSHIFCDDCVNTWFKREQTCPMCRAKISEDPTWQDGTTTFFYQLC